MSVERSGRHAVVLVQFPSRLLAGFGAIERVLATRTARKRQADGRGPAASRAGHWRRHRSLPASGLRDLCTHIKR
jgi:hypothetical protein